MLPIQRLVEELASSFAVCRQRYPIFVQLMLVERFRLLELKFRKQAAEVAGGQARPDDRTAVVRVELPELQSLRMRFRRRRHKLFDAN